MTETLTIDGMTCQHCVRAVQDALEGVDGVTVESVQIGEARVEVDETRATTDGIAAALKEEGYTLVQPTL